MSEILTPKKTDLGWVISLPDEMAEGMGVADGSIAVLHPKPAGLDVEILPPPSPELKNSVRRIHDKYRAAFKEMKQGPDHFSVSGCHPTLTDQFLLRRGDRFRPSLSLRRIHLPSKANRKNA